MNTNCQNSQYYYCYPSIHVYTINLDMDDIYFNSTDSYLTDEGLDGENNESDESANVKSCQLRPLTKSCDPRLMPRRNLRGRLAHVDFDDLYSSMGDKVLQLAQENNFNARKINALLEDFFTMIVSRNKSHDVAVAAYTMGVRRITLQTNDTSFALRKLKDTSMKFKLLSLTNSDHIKSLISLYQSLCYIRKHKFGQALTKITEAKCYLQFTKANAWTSQIYLREAEILLVHAHLMPSARKSLYQQAFSKMSTARDHFVAECGDPHKCYHLQWLILEMTYASLEMPPLFIHDWFNSNPGILTNHSNSAFISSESIEKAEKLLDTVTCDTKQTKQLECDRLVASLYLDMRKAQLALSNNRYGAALESVLRTRQALETLKEGSLHRTYRNKMYVINEMPGVLCKIKDNIFKNISQPLSGSRVVDHVIDGGSLEE